MKTQTAVIPNFIDTRLRLGLVFHTKVHSPRVHKKSSAEPKIHLDVEIFSAHLANSRNEFVMSELVAYVDGGSLGNPGPSGIGVVIDGCESGPIRIAKWIGHQDNNVAEYVALMEALHLPQLAPLFAALDLPQAGSRSYLFHLSRAARG